ncbi:hypothetical protein [Saccharothrix luteola]|uniref:hypothetical protein n=1 Tax=Saccharothrix luteola TaxID=2893018 RepID=UPI001E3990DF|nr:hypothetical protein [Saccharothrix luteola]MCC8246687.1 hypothetical protein [Saccharothrix luteola]
MPAAVDRLDFERLDRPLDGLVFGSSDDLQEFPHDYTTADLARRSDQAFSADLGAFTALLGVVGQLAQLAASGRLTGDLAWWRGLFGYFASGPARGTARAGTGRSPWTRRTAACWMSRGCRTHAGSS